MNLKELIKSHEQALIILVGYIIIAGTSFGLGRFTSPKIPIQSNQVQATTLPSNYTSNVSSAQTTEVSTDPSQPSKAPIPSKPLNCDGKIKGSSGGIYHVPGGAFYDRTTKPVRCFDTEAQAKAAGFKKSSR